MPRRGTVNRALASRSDQRWARWSSRETPWTDRKRDSWVVVLSLSLQGKYFSVAMDIVGDMPSLYLVKKQLLSHPVLYLSKYIIENKDEYYYNLGAVTQRKSWKDWIIYMLKAVEQTASHTNRIIEEIINQMQATLEYGREELKWYNKEVNEALFAQPYTKPKIIGNILGRTSRTTLTKYMSDLTRLKILSPKQDGKEVFYVNNDLIRILEG